jgi:ribonuclease Y
MALDITLLLEGAGLLGAGVALGYAWSGAKRGQQRQALAEQERTTLESARREAESCLREARLLGNEEVLKLREQTEQAFARRREEIEEAQGRLAQREALINRQLEELVQEEKTLRQQQADLTRKTEAVGQEQHELRRLVAQRKNELAKLSGLSEAEARKLILKQVEEESLRDAANLSRRILEDAKSKSESQARRILSLAIQRFAGEHTFETTTATIALDSEDVKGRIIGREGRNIRAFEAATGVTVLIDDTPNAVVISGFDPVRREIARESMQRLILDGRIHPTRIEEVVAGVTQEVEEAILHAGEEAVFRVGLPPLPLELVKLLGRLRFRHSFAQNILDHSVEVAHLAGLLASELGINAQTAKRAGLLHDIGKAINHEVEGAHALVGSEILKRYGEAEEIVNAVAAHHDEVSTNGPLGVLVSAADAISASRPGARSETMATYLKRVESLEKIGASFPGVDKCFAVQAGRELRVIVQPEAIDDDQAYVLARNIARRIEEALQYPGQIRVTVIRERRCVEFAK